MLLSCMNTFPSQKQTKLIGPQCTFFLLSCSFYSIYSSFKHSLPIKFAMSSKSWALKSLDSRQNSFDYFPFSPAQFSVLQNPDVFIMHALIKIIKFAPVTSTYFLEISWNKVWFCGADYIPQTSPDWHTHTESVLASTHSHTVSHNLPLNL